MQWSCVLNPFVPTLVAAVSLISINLVVLPNASQDVFNVPRKKKSLIMLLPVPYLLTRSVADSGCLSRIRIFPERIPGPGSKRFRIPDPHQRIQLFWSPKKLFLSSRKYDPWCSFRIPDLFFFTYPASGSATLLTRYTRKLSLVLKCTV